MNCRTVSLLMIGIFISVAATAFAGQLIPPPENLSLGPVMEAIQLALATKHPETAAKLADGLLRDHAADLLATEVGTGLLISVSARVRALMKDDADGLAAQFADQFETAAHAQLRSLRLGGSGDAQAYYAIAQRYPRTPTAAAALGLAGDCAAGIGDLPSALTYYRLGQSAGWIGDDAQQRRLAEAEVALKNPSSYQGMILFDAPWYPNVKFAGQRYFPFASGDYAFLATAEHVLAFSRQGDLLWSSPAITAAPPAPNRTGRQEPPDWNWNTPIRINALSAAGLPRVVVARDIEADGNARLVGLAGSDGRLLWSTSDQKPLAHLSFQPAPALSGQYVYDVATDSEQPGTLLLLALNVGTGAEIWRTVLGGMEMSQWQTTVLHYAAPAGIVVDGDQLILAPNVRSVIAADRFDGQIRWVNPNTGGNPPSGLPSGDTVDHLTRYDNTPYVTEGMVFVGGQDGEPIRALDAASGAEVWENGGGDMPLRTLAGVEGNVAIVAGVEIDGLDCHSGWPLWRYMPTHGANGLPVVLNGNGGTTWTGHNPAGRISGPPVVFHGMVYVPTTLGTRIISVASGEEEESAAVQPPDLRILLKVDGVREALKTDHVLENFTLPSASTQPAR